MTRSRASRMVKASVVLIVALSSLGCTPATGWIMTGAILAARAPAGDDATARERVDSAHTTGCAPNDIAVRDERRGFDYTTWTATCRGRDYACGVHGFHRVGCAPK